MVANGDGVDPIVGAIEAGIHEHVDESGVVVRYVVVAEWMDDDGGLRLYSDTMEDQRGTHTLGLLDWALTVERARVIEAFLEDEG